MTKIQEGDIIRVITKTKLSEAQKKAEELEKQEQLKRVLSGDLPQISIEAKIVEVSTTFVRRLGVQWGGGLQNKMNPGGYGYGVLAGTNPPTSPLTSLPTGVGLTNTALAVNFPATIAPAIGLVLGSDNSVISAQLSALETTGEGKLISTPRVVVMDGEKAVINQGEQIPFVTPGTATSPPTTIFKDVFLKLEVTPKVTGDGRISMTIKAANDRAEKDQKDSLGNMPIAKNDIDSKVVVKDGDTIVIGGVLKSEDTKGESGVPWIYKVPILGWLFKTQEINKTKSELLIFVTPRIFKTETPVTRKDKG
jgi:type IV pilus assembly protein PilQ